MIKLGYSEQLVKVLQNCLEETEDRRTTLEELEDFLNPIDEQQEQDMSCDEISDLEYRNQGHINNGNSQCIQVQTFKPRPEMCSIEISPMESNRRPVQYSHAHHEVSRNPIVQQTVVNDGNFRDSHKESHVVYQAQNPLPSEHVTYQGYNSDARFTSFKPSQTNVIVSRGGSNPLSMGMKRY